MGTAFNGGNEIYEGLVQPLCSLDIPAYGPFKAPIVLLDMIGKGLLRDRNNFAVPRSQLILKRSGIGPAFGALIVFVVEGNRKIGTKHGLGT